MWYIIVCVELGKSPMETKRLLERTQSVSSVSRVLVYRWQRRFLGILSSKMNGRQTVITESLTSNVLNSLQHGTRQTVRGIALCNSIAVESAHKTLTEHMYMKVGSEI